MSREGKARFRTRGKKVTGRLVKGLGGGCRVGGANGGEDAAAFYGRRTESQLKNATLWGNTNESHQKTNVFHCKTLGAAGRQRSRRITATEAAVSMFVFL